MGQVNGWVGVVMISVMTLGWSGCDQKGSQNPSGKVTTQTQLTPGPTTGTAQIEISAVFQGTPPEMPVIRVGGDPHCVAAHTSSPLLREDIVVNTGGTLRDVVVRVKSGLAPHDWSAFQGKPLVMNQDGCRFDPHVGSMMAGEGIEFRNSDKTIHNVNGQPKVNDKFNFSMINERAPSRQVTFASAEWPPVRIKCDVHPWMQAFVAVLDHPFHSVTSTTGTAVIRRLPPGEYVVEAWHRELGSQEKTVQVTDGGTAQVKFEFKQ